MSPRLHRVYHLTRWAARLNWLTRVAPVPNGQLSSARAKMISATPARDQLISAVAAARLSLPDGVLGRVPTASTRTSAGRTPIDAVTAERISPAIRSASAGSPAARDSTATAKDSRPLGVVQRTATALPARTPSTVSATRSTSVG